MNGYSGKKLTVINKADQDRDALLCIKRMKYAIYELKNRGKIKNDY